MLLCDIAQLAYPHQNSNTINQYFFLSLSDLRVRMGNAIFFEESGEKLLEYAVRMAAVEESIIKYQNVIQFIVNYFLFLYCHKSAFLIYNMETEPLTEEFKVYPKRYFVVFLYSLAQLMTSCLMSTLTPIAKFLQVIYDQDPLVVNSGALLFALMHPLFTFPAAYAIDNYGTKTGIAIGSALCLLGTGLRMLVNESFAWVIVGQVIAGIGRPFILNCQAKVSANWFTAEKRGGITQLLTLVLNVSLIIGLIIPGLVFNNYELNPVTDQKIETGKQHTFYLMAAEFIMAVICFVPNIFFQESKPPTPPSPSAIAKRDNFKAAIFSLLHNKNYILLLFAFGCYFGIFNGLSIVLSFLLTPWFKSNLAVAVGYVGGSPIISGIIGVIVLGPMQRKSGKYKKFIVICMIGSCSAMILFYPLLLTGVLALVSLVSAYNSFFLIPLVPIMLELACQTAYPVGEGMAAGLLFAMGNFAGFVMGTFLSLIVQGESQGQTAGGLAFCFGTFMIGLGLVYFMKEKLNRTDSERKSIERGQSGLEASIDEQYKVKPDGDKTQLKEKLLSPIKPTESGNDNVML